jgi:hypothetical protein
VGKGKSIFNTKTAKPAQRPRSFFHMTRLVRVIYLFDISDIEAADFIDNYFHIVYSANMSIKKTSIQRPSVKEIRSIFPSATGVGIILPELDQGLHIEFSTRADFFGELKISSNTSTIYSTPLVQLAKSFSFVTLNNCFVPEFDSASGLSYGMNDRGFFIQDPFHRDFKPYQNTYVTVLMPQVLSTAAKPEGRVEPSYYGLECDIRAAIGNLDKIGLDNRVKRALSEMQQKDYRFRLFDEYEMGARDVIQRLYPEFTEAVFSLLPKSRKFAKYWKEGVWDMAIHSNSLESGFLHGRPTGHRMRVGENPLNPIRGLELY